MFPSELKKYLRTSYIIFTLISMGFVGLLVFVGVMDEGGVEAAPTSYIVDWQGGGDFTTIQQAVNNANPGDTIYVYNGTYYENLVINKTLTLIGNGTTNCTIDGGGSGHVVDITKDYVNVSNIQITNGGSNSLDSGVYIYFKNYTKINNCDISNSDVGIMYYGPSHNLTVMNCQISYTVYGIYLFDSKDCVIDDNNVSGNSGYGIAMEYSSNNDITNNTCSSNTHVGIVLYSSTDNYLYNNTCGPNNGDGIYLNFSDENTLDGNTCSGNSLRGIYLHYSDINTLDFSICSNNGDEGMLLYVSVDNTVSGSTCNSNTDGIYVYWSDSNDFIFNDCQMNSDFGIYSDSSESNHFANNTMTLCGLVLAGNYWEHYNSHNIEVSNMVNGKSTYYWKNQTSGFVPAGAGQVILVNCTGVTVQNQNCSEASIGIYMVMSDNNYIDNNNCSWGTWTGIYVYDSYNNTLIDNTCSSNDKTGIYLNVALNNTIENNTINLNSVYGIELHYSPNCTIIKNTCNLSTDNGIWVVYSDNTTIDNNTCGSNQYHGISLIGSSKCKVTSNNCSYNTRFGIYDESSVGNTLYNNTCSDNTEAGIYLYTSTDNTISKNRCNDNGLHGIYLNYSWDLTIIDNTLNSNGETGIYFYYSDSNVIDNNDCSYNDWYGIFMNYSLSNKFTNNTMLSDGIHMSGGWAYQYNTHTIDTTNTVNGKPVYFWKNQTSGIVPGGAGQVILINCSYVTVESQNCSDGSVAIHLVLANNNTIDNNIFNSNKWSGIILVSSHDNTIKNNSFSFNGGPGIYLHYSAENTISNNTCDTNNQHGFLLDFSSHNTFTSNTCLKSEYGIKIFSSNLNSFYQDDFTDHTIYQLKITNSNNNTFDNCSFVSTTSNGTYFDNSRDIYFNNSVINTTQPSYALILNNNAEVILMDSTFDNDTFYFDPGSKLYVQYYLDVKVEDQASAPVTGASIDIDNVFGSPAFSGSTDGTGGIDMIPLNYYIEDSSSFIYQTPHNITASKTNYFTGYAMPEPFMDQNRDITVSIEKISIDYLIIRSAPGGAGFNVTEGHYSLGGTDIFYAAGYNNKIGYVQDVVVTWNSNNTLVATVTSPGSATTFTASLVNHGMVRISAEYGSVKTYVEVYVDVTKIDFIVIQDTSDQSGKWIDARDYPLGGSGTYHCVGYNYTLGYIGPVSAVWQSLNTAFITVTSPGLTTTFTASSVNYGTTRIRATYSSITNDTGLLTVLPPTVDRIEINSGPNGTGTWVNNIIYTVDDVDMFYCAGYNATSGFVTDLDATWLSSQPTVATVTTPGFVTIFKAVGGGTVKIEAASGGMTNTTGFLTVNATPPSNFDLTVQVTITPTSPVLVNTNVTVNASVENLGTDPVNNIAVHLYLGDPDQAGSTFIEEKVISFLSGLGKTAIDFVYKPTNVRTDELFVIVDPLEKIIETSEANNRDSITVEAVALIDWIVSIDVTPADSTVTADDVVQFYAFGIGQDSISYPIQPSWSISGGGTIDTNGLFTANEGGSWAVYADYGGYKGSTMVTVTPGALTSIEITTKKTTLKIGESFTFGVTGYDSDGNHITIPANDVEWYVNGTIGVIDPTGKFTAENESTGKIEARTLAGGIWYSDEIDVVVKVIIINEKKYEIKSDKVTYDIQIAFTGEGNATIDDLSLDDLIAENIPEESFTDEIEHIGVFVKIEIPVGADFEWILIEIEYDPTEIPPDFPVEDLVIFFFDDIEQKWVRCDDSWVDTANNLIIANVTHLTIFAPMAEKGAGPGEEEDAQPEEPMFGMSLIVILTLAAALFVIALATGVIIIRRRRTMLEPPERVREEPEEREFIEEKRMDREMPVDLSQLSIKTKRCPSCSTKIDVEPSFDDKIHLKCPECDKKGYVPNPYLAEIKILTEERKEERRKRREREEKEERKKREKEKEKEKEEKKKPKGPEPIKIECPGCGEKLDVPYSKKLAKVGLECHNCDSYISIANPYLKKKKEKAVTEIKRSKPSKPKEPPKKEEPKKVKKEPEITWDDEDEDEQAASKKPKKKTADDDDFDFFEDDEDDELDFDLD